MKDYIVIERETDRLVHDFDSLEEARDHVKDELTGAFHVFSRADTITVTREKIEKVSVTTDPKVRRARKVEAAK